MLAVGLFGCLNGAPYTECAYKTLYLIQQSNLGHGSAALLLSALTRVEGLDAVVVYRPGRGPLQPRRGGLLTFPVRLVDIILGNDVTHECL